jgi:hypothetical protein
MRSAGIVGTVGCRLGSELIVPLQLQQPPELLEDFTDRLMIRPEASGARRDGTPPCIQ